MSEFCLEVMHQSIDYESIVCNRMDAKALILILSKAHYCSLSKQKRVEDTHAYLMRLTQTLTMDNRIVLLSLAEDY